MAHVLLIEPRPTAFHVYSAFRIPRLGLPLLGAILEKEGHTVDVYLQGKRNIPLGAFASADVVGVSTTTSTAHEAYKIARMAKFFGKPVMLGGSHASFMPEEGLRHADVVVHGEAEASTPLVVTALAQGSPLQGIQGVSHMDGEQMITAEPSPAPTNLDDLPFPDFSLLRGLRKRSSTPVQTSRGCPYRCNFCSVTAMFGHRYRFRSPENVLEELEYHRGKRVFFCDDNFTAHPGRSKKLLEGMLRNNIRLDAWSAQTRVDVVKDPELLQLMTRTGCHRVYIGFESVNEDTLKALNKRQDVADIENAITRLHHHGIAVHGMFIHGSDSDQPGDVAKTLQFAKDMAIDSIQFLALTPLPGTKTFRELESDGRLLTRDWRYFDGHHVVFDTRNIPSHQLQHQLMHAMSQFYSLRSALGKAVRLDGIGTVLRIMGHSLVTKAIKSQIDFTSALERGEFSRSRFSEQLVFSTSFTKNWAQAQLRSLKDKNHRLKITIATANELKSRASFFRLSGLMERREAKHLYKVMKEALKKGRPNLVVSFERNTVATPKALHYLGRKLNGLNRSVSLIGLTEHDRASMFNAIKTVPCFEFFDSEDAFVRTTPL